MEVSSGKQGVDLVEKCQNLVSSMESPVASAENVKKAMRSSKPIGVEPVAKRSGATSSLRKSSDSLKTTDSRATRPGSTLTKPTVSSINAQRRNSTGSALEKKPAIASKQFDNGSSTDERKVSRSNSDLSRKSIAETRRASLPSVSSKTKVSDTHPENKKSSPVPRLLQMSESGKLDSVKKPSVRPSLLGSTSKKAPSSPLDNSTGRSSSLKRVTSNISSPSTRSPRTISSLKSGSMSSSMDRGSSLSGRRKSSTPDGRDSRFMMLPQVDIKASDELVSSSGLKLGDAQWKEMLLVHWMTSKLLVFMYLVKVCRLTVSFNFFIILSFFFLFFDHGDRGWIEEGTKYEHSQP